MQIFAKPFRNYLSTDIKLSKSQIFKMIQSGGFLGPLLKTGLPLMKNVIKPWAKSVLIPLGLTAAASAADAGIHKKSLRIRSSYSSSPLRDNNTILIISNDEMKDIIKVVKYLENSSLLFKAVSKRIQNEAKEQRRGFLNMLLCY